MIRHIPIPSCSSCPYREFHYGEHECAKFNYQRLPEQRSENGISPNIPEWCPLPPHPSFIKEH